MGKKTRRVLTFNKTDHLCVTGKYL